MDLGNKIKNIRLELGETMEEFGSRFHTSKGTVNNWEKNRNKPNKTNLKNIAALKNISVTELLSNNINTKNSLDDELLQKLKQYLEHKKKFAEQKIQFLNPALESALSTFDRDTDAGQIPIMNSHQEYTQVLQKLKTFGEQYINENYDNYTYDQYLKDFPESGPKGFQKYKEKEWILLKELLDHFWNAFDYVEYHYSWVNRRFTDQIADELQQIQRLANKEGKENYYVNEVIQPFFDQAASDFKKYIKEKTEIE